MGVTVAVTRAACNTSAGTQDITTTDLGGLTPKAALFILSAGVTDGTAASGASFGIGAATGATNRWCITGRSDDAQGTTITFHENHDDRCIAFLAASDTTEAEADFSAFITNGVRIDWQTGLAPASAYLLTVVLFAGTDLSAYAAAQNLGNTLDLTTDVTAPGFEPDILIVAKSERNIPEGPAAHSSISVGAVHNDGAGGITHRCYGHKSRDNVTTTEEYNWLHTSYGAIEINPGGTIKVGLEFSDFDSSGFSVTTRIGAALQGEMGYLALSFGGVVDSWVGTYSTPTSTGNDSDTGPGFTPQALIFGMTQVETVNTQISDGTAGTSGIAVIDADEAYATSQQSEDGVATSNTQSISDNTAIELPDDDGAAGLTASFVSFDASGWTLNYSAVEANAKLFWAVAIEEEAAGGRTTRNTDTYGLGIGAGVSRTIKVGVGL